jgi:hypothetical protein
MCVNYVHDPVQPFDRNLRAKVRIYYISRLFISHLCFIICRHVFEKRLHLLFVISCSGYIPSSLTSTRGTSRELPVMLGRGGCAWLSGKRERKKGEAEGNVPSPGDEIT